MKKRMLPLFLCLALVLGLAPATAAAPGTVMAMKIGSPWCVIGSEIAQMDAAASSVVPVMDNGRTLLPIRRVLETFGGTVEWKNPTVICSLNGVEVSLRVGERTATVGGETVELDVPAKLVNGRTLVPVRFVSENLGLTVGYAAAHQIVVVGDGDLPENSELGSLPQVKLLVEKTTPKGEPLALKSGSFTLPSGKVSANVVTVNLSDPRVTVRAALPGGKLNQTQGFSSLAANSGAAVVINANYFEAYQTIKDPIGHVMVDGEFKYASSGAPTLGITAEGKAYFGEPGVFVHLYMLKNGERVLWDSVYEVNVRKQFAGQAVLYTPARGDSFPVTYPGWVLIAENNTSTEYRAVAVGETVSIPQNGFVAYYSNESAANAWHKTPELGLKMECEPYLYCNGEGFTMDGMKTIVAGGPWLVRNGAVVTDLGIFASDQNRFGKGSNPRTAVGATADGKLLLVNVSSATMQQMRELMLQLGCVNAFNLDGGGSTAMYYQGKTLATPGRELTTTLQVFVGQ